MQLEDTPFLQGGCVELECSQRLLLHLFMVRKKKDSSPSLTNRPSLLLSRMLAYFFYSLKHGPNHR